jgi:hypothetical protein
MKKLSFLTTNLAAMSQGMSHKDKVELFWKKQNLTIKAKFIKEVIGLTINDSLKITFEMKEQFYNLNNQ